MWRTSRTRQGTAVPTLTRSSLVMPVACCMLAGMLCKLQPLRLSSVTAARAGLRIPHSHIDYEHRMRPCCCVVHQARARIIWGLAVVSYTKPGHAGQTDKRSTIRIMWSLAAVHSITDTEGRPSRASRPTRYWPHDWVWRQQQLHHGIFAGHHHAIFLG